MNQIGLLLEPIRRKHVLKAIEKFNELGRDEFLKEYKFGKAKTCWLIYKGRPYDSKAIVGLAYDFATDSDPLTPYDDHFYGGDPVLKKLSSLGFECKKGSRPNSQL